MILIKSLILNPVGLENESQNRPKQPKGKVQYPLRSSHRYREDLNQSTYEEVMIFEKSLLARQVRAIARRAPDTGFDQIARDVVEQGGNAWQLPVEPQCSNARRIQERHDTHPQNSTIDRGLCHSLQHNFKTLLSFSMVRMLPRGVVPRVLCSSLPYISGFKTQSEFTTLILSF